MESDRDGEFAKEVEHWYKADLDDNKILNETEFLAFIHPEHNKKTLRAMVDEMMPNFDKNHDKVRSFSTNDLKRLDLKKIGWHSE